MVALVAETEAMGNKALVPDQPGSPSSRREMAAERRARPSFHDIAVSAAEKHGVCVRPLMMRTFNRDTAISDYVAVPCKSTVESQCPPCAKKARLLRIAQCREGWHRDDEPVQPTTDPTGQQAELLETRADLVCAYREAAAEDDLETTAKLREVINDLDASLRATGLRGKLPLLDVPAGPLRRRSTKRRQDAPDLPTRQIQKTTIGREYAGRYRPSMFLTLTCDSYGPIHAGAPIKAESYEYRRAARDAIHFAALIDRLVQNLRRVVGWEVQYFATVEPQKRAAPHLHMALRGAIPHKLVRQVVAATYHQVWWPNHDQLVYADPRHQPIWDHHARTFVDPDTHRPLKPWDEALEALADEKAQPAHVVRFGAQVSSRGMLGGTEEAARHIGYLTKYLTKSISEVLQPDSAAQQAHHDRLHTELATTPCSERCPVWLRYGIVPRGANARTVAGQCKGRAHRRSTLGLRGRRVLVSRRWSGKTLPDHRADREEFVRQLLAVAGVNKPDCNRDNVLIYRVDPGDRNAPPRDELIIRAVAQRIAWKTEYDKALLAAGPPGGQQISAT